MAAAERLILSTMAKGARKNSASHTSGTAMTQPRPGRSRRRRRSMAVGFMGLLACSGAFVTGSLVPGLFVKDDGTHLVPADIDRLVPVGAVAAALHVGQARLDQGAGLGTHVVDREPPQVGDVLHRAGRPVVLALWPRAGERGLLRANGHPHPAFVGLGADPVTDVDVASDGGACDDAVVRLVGANLPLEEVHGAHELRHHAARRALV